MLSKIELTAKPKVNLFPQSQPAISTHESMLSSLKQMYYGNNRNTNSTRETYSGALQPTDGTRDSSQGAPRPLQ